MKKTVFIILTACLLPFCSCSALIESQIESLGDRLDELGDELDDLGDRLDEMDVAFDSTDTASYYTIIDNGRITKITVNKNQININKNDKLKTRKFNIKDYNALSVGYSFVVVMCDTVDSVTVRINEKLDKYLVVKVSNGTLNISLDLIGGLKSDNTKCGYVYLPYNLKLQSFSLSGEATFATILPINTAKINVDLAGASRFKGKIECRKFTSDLSGTARCRADIKCQSADIDLAGASCLEANLSSSTVSTDLSGTAKLKGNITSTSFNASLSGASNMELAGKCDKAHLDMSGASNFNCKKLNIKTIDGDMSGASNATVNCSELLRIELNGTSHLSYYGNPRTDIDASRTAKVERK